MALLIKTGVKNFFFIGKQKLVQQRVKSKYLKSKNKWRQGSDLCETKTENFAADDPRVIRLCSAASKTDSKTPAVRRHLVAPEKAAF